MLHDHHTSHPPPLLDSANAEMARAIALARQVAASDVSVLLTGESGTGKHVLAAAIHDWSGRCGSLVTVRRSAPTLPRHEGELFPCFDGVREGLQRVAPADGMTLFFEEVADLPLAQQATLVNMLDRERLDVSESTDVPVRVIAATTRDLDAQCRAGRFRSDLFFHLSTVQLHLPPLRERLEDLPALTDHLLAELAGHYHREPLRIAPAVRPILARYSWPGNVRELKSTIERGVVLSRSDVITLVDLPERLLGRPRKMPAEPPPRPLSLQDLERHHIEEAIRASATLEEAATKLGIAATTLWRKRKRYGL